MVAWGPILSAGASILGGIFGKSGQDKANETNLQIARENTEFQERMSNTAHQREIKDLEAAGLNPILSATGGSGASVPTGSVAHVENSMSSLSNSAKDLSDKLMQNPITAATVDNLKAENQRIKAQTQQLAISNAKDGVTLPLYEQAAKGVKKAVDLTTGKLGDAGDIVQQVLDAGGKLSSGIADGDVSIPNSAFDLSRFVGSDDSEARKWARGEKSFWQSLRDANKPADNANSARSLKTQGAPMRLLTPDMVKKYGLKHSVMD